VERCGAGGDSAAAVRICVVPSRAIEYEPTVFARGEDWKGPHLPSARTVTLKVMESGVIRRAITGD
jgi:hypothetical protein